MPAPPSWWSGLAAHLAAHRHPIYAADLIATTARLLLHAESCDPRSLLARAKSDAPELVGALTDFFRTHGHLDPPPPPRLADRRATERRSRRIESTPAPLRSQTEKFAAFLLLQREQAEHLGLRPNQLKTIEIRLAAVRDLALHLHTEGHTNWASVTTAHMESFLALNPALRASRLAGLRQFFAYAHHAKVILHNPTDPITAVQHRGFHGPTLTLTQQRTLYQRWTTHHDIHPHEAFIGLAALLHAATITELRQLTDTGINPHHHSVHFPGRSLAIPLDDATWTALQRCQEHRHQLGSDNPHLLVTRLTRTHHGPAGAAHIRDTLAPTGLRPRILRSTRLLTLADELDAKILTTSLGMSYAGVAHYRPSPNLTKPI